MDGGEVNTDTGYTPLERLCVCVYMCVLLKGRERERERERGKKSFTSVTRRKISTPTAKHGN